MSVALFIHKYNIKHCFQQLSIPGQKTLRQLQDHVTSVTSNSFN